MLYRYTPPGELTTFRKPQRKDTNCSLILLWVLKEMRSKSVYLIEHFLKIALKGARDKRAHKKRAKTNG